MSTRSDTSRTRLSHRATRRRARRSTSTTASIRWSRPAVASGWDAATVRAAVSTGVVQYLIKPFTFAAFRERLEAYRAYVEGLDRAAGDATQSEVDALLGTLRTVAAPALPKGLSDETLQAVADTTPMTATATHRATDTIDNASTWEGSGRPIIGRRQRNVGAEAVASHDEREVRVSASEF